MVVLECEFYLKNLQGQHMSSSVPLSAVVLEKQRRLKSKCSVVVRTS